MLQSLYLSYIRFGSGLIWCGAGVAPAEDDDLSEDDDLYEDDDLHEDNDLSEDDDLSVKVTYQVSHRLKTMTYRSKCTMMRAKSEAALSRAQDEVCVLLHGPHLFSQ